MDRKVFVEVKVRLVIRADEGVEIAGVIDEMELAAASNTEGADIEDVQVLSHEVVDSK
jgi:hypothetical protein